MAEEKRRRSPKRAGKRKRAQRRRGKVIAIVIAAVLLLGIAGLGVRIVYERFIAPSVVTYIVEYMDEIRAAAAENGLEPAYVAAVVMAESSYRPGAVSSANAQGLMQLLPSTAEWIAGKFDETYTEGALFDPETNLRYGCWYLGWLMRRYDGDMRCASSAYHAGQGTVDGWLQNPDYSSDGKTLSVIPFDSTRTYVERVLKYYEKYEVVYANS